MMITGKQVAMARVALGLNKLQLSKLVKYPRADLAHFEKDAINPTDPTRRKFKDFFESKGIRFTDSGVEIG